MSAHVACQPTRSRRNAPTPRARRFIYASYADGCDSHVTILRGTVRVIAAAGLLLLYATVYALEGMTTRIPITPARELATRTSGARSGELRNHRWQLRPDLRGGVLLPEPTRLGFRLSGRCCESRRPP